MKKLLFLAIPVLLLSGCSYGTIDNLQGQDSKLSLKSYVTTSSEAIPMRGTIQNQTQCAADGKVFFETHWSKSSPPDYSAWSYDGPEYHLSKKLNTCLVYVGENSPFSNTTFSSHYSLEIYDIYANQNQPILQSETDRTCPPGGQCTEVLKAAVFSGVQNLNTNDFKNQKDILFNQ